MFNSGKPTFLQLKGEKSQPTNPREEATINRLAEKSNPYCKLELDEISHRAYSSPIIQERKSSHNIVENLSDDITKVLVNH